MDNIRGDGALRVLHRALIYEPFEGRPGRAVRVEVELGAEPERLWSAMTRREELAAWAGEVSGELRKGGSFSVADNASGRILRCEPKVIVQTDWDFGGAPSVVEGRISPASTGAELTLTNTMPDVQDEEWDTYGPGAAGVGWELMLCALQHYLVTGQRLDDEEWTRSPDGRATIHEWSNAWAAIHHTAGQTCTLRGQRAREQLTSTSGLSDMAWWPTLPPAERCGAVRRA